jgi:hypothetical protein
MPHTSGVIDAMFESRRRQPSSSSAAAMLERGGDQQDADRQMQCEYVEPAEEINEVHRSNPLEPAGVGAPARHASTAFTTFP